MECSPSGATGDRAECCLSEMQMNSLSINMVIFILSPCINPVEGILSEKSVTTLACSMVLPVVSV
jgi:hypothetical protein